MAVADKLNELVIQRDNLANNLNTMGVSASTDETLSTLVPKVLDIEKGPDISEYFDKPDVASGSSNSLSCGNWIKLIKKIPTKGLVFGTSAVYYFYNFAGTEIDSTNWDTSSTTDMKSMFYNCKIIKAPNIDTRNVTNTSSMYSYCTNLKEVPDYDLSNVTNLTSMFYACTNLEEVGDFNTSKATTLSKMFRQCSKLVTIGEVDASSSNNIKEFWHNTEKVVNFGGLKNLGKGFTYKSVNHSDYTFYVNINNSLTHDSLMNIINKLYDLNLTYDVANGGTLYTQSLVLGSTNLAKLTAEEIAIATNKGWTVS